MAEKQKLLPIDGKGSGKPSTCPTCGRGDGACRISANGEVVLCHAKGTSFSPPTTKAGDTFTETDEAGGRQWICDGPTKGSRCIGFHLKPAAVVSNASTSIPARLPAEFRKDTPSTTSTTAAPAMADSQIQHQPQQPQIQLARLPKPPEKLPPDHLPDGAGLFYGPRQRAVVIAKPGEKKRFCPQHLPDHIPLETEEEREAAKELWEHNAGPHPWPLFRQADAVTHGRDLWVVDAEGEKCTQWVRCGGLAAVSHPGHDHTVEACTARYRTLVEAGVAGVAYIADNDRAGTEKAQTLLRAAAAAGLPIRIIPAAEIWPNLPDGGSIDDAPGAPAERVEALLKAVSITQPPDSDEQREQMAAALLAELKDTRSPRKSDLQGFLELTYKLEYNELTRDYELNGTPLEDHHLADSFLAKQHGIEVPKQMAADSFEFVAKSNPYNPIRRYLLSLKGKPNLRLITMPELARAFAIKKGDAVSEYLLAAHLAGAALRGLDPGYRHHQMVIFNGMQGNGKGETIEALSNGLYDSTTKTDDLEGKDFLAKVNGCWLFEFEECDHVLMKRSAEEFKGFITRRIDRYVEKYEKRSRKHPRRSVPFGTTNKTEFLNDSTGNRRIWAIDTGDRYLDPKWVAENRDSIWATVLTWIDWGLQSHLQPNDEMALKAAELAEAANLSDPWEGALAKVLDGRTVDFYGGIAQDDLIEKALNLPIGQADRSVQMRVTRVVTGSGFRTHNDTVAWKTKKARYSSGSSRAGYMPVLQPLPWGSKAPAGGSSVPTGSAVPTDSASVPTDSGEDGTLQTPWDDSDLTTLFQPVPTFSRRVNRRNTQVGTAVPVPGESSEHSVGTGRNTPENPSAASDLPVPTGSERSDLGTEQGASSSEQGSPPADLFSTTSPPTDPRWQPITFASHRGDQIPDGLAAGDLVRSPSGGTEYELGTPTSNNSWQATTGKLIPIGKGWQVRRSQPATAPPAPPTPASTAIPPVGTAIELAGPANTWKPGYRLESVGLSQVRLTPVGPEVGKNRISRALADLGNTWRAAA